MALQVGLLATLLPWISATSLDAKMIETFSYF
jgi:hypothetical protein